MFLKLHDARNHYGPDTKTSTVKSLKGLHFWRTYPWPMNVPMSYMDIKNVTLIIFQTNMYTSMDRSKAIRSHTMML